jgi:hypothetical protein
MSAWVRPAFWVAVLAVVGCEGEAYIRLFEPRDGGQPASGLDGGPLAALRFEDSLVLQYDFSGIGDVVHDRVGDHHARLLGGTRQSAERPFIHLDGVDDYVDIPRGVVSGLRSATFIVWLMWRGGMCSQRIFHFGIGEQGEDDVGNAATSLSVSPKACGVETFNARAELAVRSGLRTHSSRARSASFASTLAP